MTKLYDFSENLNWDLALRRNLLATPAQDWAGHIPLVSVNTTVEQPIIIVGCSCTHERRKSTWWLGCWVSFGLFISPSSTSAFLPTVFFHKAACPLDRQTLIIAPEIRNNGPYLVFVDIPRWLPQFYIEIWKYSGEVQDLTDNLVNEGLSDLIRIEAKIDTLI